MKFLLKASLFFVTTRNVVMQDPGSAPALRGLPEHQRIHRAKMGSGPEKTKWHGA